MVMTLSAKHRDARMLRLNVERAVSCGELDLYLRATTILRLFMQ